MKNTYDIPVKQGEDLYLVLELRDSGNNLIDITGHTFRGQIRRTASDTEVVASFTFSVLNQTTDKGKVQVHLSNTTSSSIQLNSSQNAQRSLTIMAYDIESEYSGRVTRWLEGTVIFSPEVTK
jgi:hypothetical protein